MYQHLPDRFIICLDMKCFYASCIAMLEGIDVMTTPVAVIANFEQPGSVVLAASPPLKEKYQIKTGSRKYEIPKDPSIRLFPPKMAFFVEMSVKIAQLIAEYVPRSAMHVYSVDEIFVDLTATTKLWGSPEKTARMIQQAIYDQFRLLSAVGLGPNMLMAKLALDLDAKKTGFAAWTYEDVPKKLWKVSPLSNMWGIGKNLERRLHDLGIRSVKGLAHADLKLLERKFGVIGNQLYHHAWGIDLSELGEPLLEKSRSFSKGQILLRDYHKREDIELVLLEMCDAIGKRAREAGYAGQTISLALSYSNDALHKGFRRSKTIQSPTNDATEIFRTCQLLLHTYMDDFPVRQLSVSISKLTRSESVQLDFFDPDKVKRLALAKTVDSLQNRFGPNVILRATSYTEPGTARRRNQLVGGHLA